MRLRHSCRCDRPVRSPWQLFKYADFTPPHSSSCSDLLVSLTPSAPRPRTGQISAFRSLSSWINNFSFPISAFVQANCGGGGQWSRLPRVTADRVRPRWSSGSPAWWGPATAGDTAPGLSASLRSVTLHPAVGHKTAEFWLERLNHHCKTFFFKF